MSVKKSLYIFFSIAAVSLFFVDSLKALPEDGERESLRVMLDSMQASAIAGEAILHADSLAGGVLPAADSLPLPDSLMFSDSLRLSDSLMVSDTVENFSSIEEPVFSTARDSIVEIYEDGKRMIYFYGDISVK